MTRRAVDRYPLFLVILGVVLVGVALTPTTYLMDRADAAG
jgi:hypothetical protein